MLKHKQDFDHADAYSEYVRSIDFLESYSLVGKTARQIQEDLCIKQDWLPYVERVLQDLKKRNRMTGIYMILQIDELVIRNENYDAWIKQFDK